MARNVHRFARGGSSRFHRIALIYVHIHRRVSRWFDIGTPSKGMCDGRRLRCRVRGNGPRSLAHDAEQMGLPPRERVALFI